VISFLSLPSFSEIAILWFGDVLTYYKGEKEVDFHPSQKQWETFWEIMNKIHAWNWSNN